MERRIAIIGAGAVGLACAYQIQQKLPSYHVTVIEKENKLAQHQTGRNSGVIHSGIYYKPGSLKADNCIRGKSRLIAFCEEHGIKYDITGKVIVASREEELGQLKLLLERAEANHVPVRLLDSDELRQVEPYARGLAALHVPSTGIIDFSDVAIKLAELIRAQGGSVVTGFKVENITEYSRELIIESSNQQEVSANLLINCAGLESDRIAKMMGIDPGMQIVPFRGEYYKLRPERSHLCKGLIYPVPDPAFPFLGVHLTKMISGAVECGPNAVLAFAREGYSKTDFSPHDMMETLSYQGFRRLAARYWKNGLKEMYRSLSKPAFARALQRLVPEISIHDLDPAPSGIRAQAVLDTGVLADDFIIKESSHAVHVLNAPSPAATSCLSIGDHVSELIKRRTIRP